MIDAHTSPVPAVLEIPSKDHPYDASKDSILRRARVSLRIKAKKVCNDISLSGYVQSRGSGSLKWDIE